MDNYPPITVLFYMRKNKNIFRDYNARCCIKIRGQNKTELCVEKGLSKQDWDTKKGKPKQKSEYLIKLGIYLESIKSKLLTIYLNLKLKG